MLINFYDQVPSIYPAISRDFQYLSWLVNIVLNSVKHNVDDLYNLPNTKADPKLVELLAMTLGFKVKRNYDQKQLIALVSIIPSILKYKGTKKAVSMAGEALITASGALGSFSCETKGNLLEVVLPKELIDTTLFIDLLPYILPAGMTCRIIRKTQLHYDATTEVSYNDSKKAYWHKDVEWNNETRTSTGLAGLYIVPNSDNAAPDDILPEFANYKLEKDDQGNDVLNAGLLSNSVIPTLEDPLWDQNTNKKEEEN